MKVAVLTSLFNDPPSGFRQSLHTPTTMFEGVSYYAFVNEIHSCSGWKQIMSPSFTLDKKYRGRRDAKIYKIMSHLFLPDYDYWVWTDPTHEAVVDPREICEMLEDKEIGVFKHAHRKCPYEEAAEVSRLGVDHVALVDAQVEYYRSEGFPGGQGLYELPVSVRKNTPAVQSMNMKWWELICRYSSRDQISLPFVLWKMGIEPHIFEGLSNGGLHKNNILPQVRWKG
jgi:hypothetical protein